MNELSNTIGNDFHHHLHQVRHFLGNFQLEKFNLKDKMLIIYVFKLKRGKVEGIKRTRDGRVECFDVIFKLKTSLTSS